MYDAIVVGARVAGAAMAMLLARRGYHVLAVERASFPSDTLSSHQVQLPGVARLQSWGLLDRVVAAGTPATRKVKFRSSGVELNGRFPEFEGIDSLFSPRRAILDKILVDGAREAGAEVRERFTVDEIVMSDGQVSGIRGRESGGGSITETARLVIGADGKHSVVARAVSAPTYFEKPPLSAAYYTYWHGVEVAGGEMYALGRRAVGVWPTNDNLVVTYIGWPREEFPEVRADIQGSFLKVLDQAGDLGERVRAGRQAERFMGTADTPNFFRKPYGPGWALVGDAGLTMDPVTGQGIGHALQQAQDLSEAIDAGFSGAQELGTAMAAFETKRNAVLRPSYDFTLDLASFKPPQIEQQVLFRALAERQADVDQFFGVLTGVVPSREFFGPRNLLRMIGLKGLGRIFANKLRPARQTGVRHDT